MKQNVYWYFGIFSVIFYLFAVTLGGLMYPGYSHISMDVSQLTSTESPIRNFMNIFFVYNLFVSFFGLGLMKISKNKISKVASASLILIGILGIVISWFPINTRGTEITATGIIHIVIVSVISLLTVTGGFLFYYGFRKTYLKNFAKVSLTAGILFLISGPLAAINVLSPYAGLYERIPIGIFLTWILATSFIMLKSKPNAF